jgi:hypothetical protein
MTRVDMVMTLPLGANDTFSKMTGPASWPLPTVKPMYLKGTGVRNWGKREKGRERTRGDRRRRRRIRRC